MPRDDATALNPNKIKQITKKLDIKTKHTKPWTIELWIKKA